MKNPSGNRTTVRGKIRVLGLVKLQECADLPGSILRLITFDTIRIRVRLLIEFSLDSQ